MKRFANWCCVLTVYGATSVATARSPIPIDHPTPPPCAADGTCYPNRGEWGYYPVRWRAWPGVELEPTSDVSPTPAEERRISPELGPTETPPPELEDAAAPPSSPKREAPPAAAPESDTTAPTSDDTGLPNIPLPDDETPPPAGPTSDLDPPPAFPSAASTPSRAAKGRQAAAPIKRGDRNLSVSVSSHDPPPAPPWAHSASL